MHSSPSRQSSGDDAEEDGGVEESSDGEGVADDVSVPDGAVSSAAVGVGEAVVSVLAAVSVASDMVEAACDSAEAVTPFS
jgi:hypothetical protein